MLRVMALDVDLDHLAEEQYLLGFSTGKLLHFPS